MSRMLKKKNGRKVPMEDRITKVLEIPKEVLLNIPIITLTGNRDLCVENFIGLVEYSNECIKISTQCGLLTISGTELEAKSMTYELITIRGNITSMSYGE